MFKKSHDKEGEKKLHRPDVPVGGVMREARESLGLSLQDVVEHTRISRSNIEAIENDNFFDLPADVFVKGQIILYCDLLGLDGRQIAGDFLARKGCRSAIHDSCNNNVRLSEPVRLSSFPVAAILFVLIVYTFIAIYFPGSTSSFTSVFKEQKKRVVDDSMENLFVTENGRYIYGGDLLKETFISPFVRDFTFKNNHNENYVKVVLRSNDTNWSSVPPSSKKDIF